MEIHKDVILAAFVAGIIALIAWDFVFAGILGQNQV